MQQRISALSGEAWWLFAAVNALNVADAALTRVAVGGGVAIEANPIIGMIGMSGKIALVAAASAALMVVRPKALWVPLLALAVVVAYTTTGLLVAA